MKINNEDGKLTIFLEGRIDSSNAAAVEAEIASIRAANPAENVVFDVESLEYISSAGLRVILRTRKEVPTLKIVNASSEVYEIFEMTGFTEMIPVEKAYRRLSVDGCEVIGKGANGKVYRYDPDTIVKVYFNPDALPDIHRERELARKAFVLGIPTAIPYDVVKVGDGYGSVFELLSATSYSKLISGDPDNYDKYVDDVVELLQKIHSTEVKPDDMPSMRDVAIGWAKFLKDYLPEEYAAKLLSLVEAVPEDNHMLHGDYHTNNVMMQNGEVLLIDMDTLCHGNPVFEFASVYLAFAGYSDLNHDNVKDFLGIDYSVSTRIWKDIIKRYFNTEDEAKIAEIENKAKVIGYNRMMRRTIRRNGFDTEEGRATIEHCKAQLMELLPKVDTLLLA